MSTPAATLTAAQEGAQISAVYEDSVRDGQTWHVVDSDWFDHWKQYTGFDTISECVRYTPAGERPGPIDNSKLIDPEYRDEAAVLTKSLTDGIDYVLLEERTAKLLEEWYGGPGPIIVRKVITVGGPSYASKKKVELYPAFLKLIPCGQDGKPDESKAIVTCVSEKASFSDIQEAQHKAVLQREADEPCIRTPPAEPAGADMSDSTPETSTNAGGVDADMEEGHMTEMKTLPKVTETDDEASAQTSRVRLWTRKRKPEGAASSSDDSSSTALVPVSGVIDHSMPGLLGGASTAMDIDDGESKEGESKSASSAAASSSSAAVDDGFGSCDGDDYKSSMSVPPPEQSLDPADGLSADDATVRVTPLEKPALEQDEWYLLIEEELTEPLEAFQLPPLTPVLVESSYYVTRTNADGSLDFVTQWPRSAYHREKTWKDFDVGDIVDVKDTQDTWCVAKVRGVKRDGTAIYVAYKKYSSKWNAWVPTDPKLGRVGDANSHTATAQNAAASSSSHNNTTSAYSSYTSSRSSYSYFSSNEQGTPEVAGAVGLKNLGNTCFMNSTLQCLSHSVPLTEYFLDDSYRPHLNRDNPLGWKGRVAEEYAKMLKEIWSGKYRSVAPRDLKTEIATVQPRFEGYAQHDSSELLSFLLDGLHEDLNRVLKKPPTNSVDSNNRPDAEVAAEAWATYKLRNESIIVDLMQGQLKSTVVCPQPDCGRVSITFDPVQLLSVPLPVASDTIVKVKLVYADGRRPIVEVAAVVAKSARLSELKAAVCAQVGDISNPRRLILGDMFSHRIYKYFDEDGVVSDIKSNDLVYAFECPEVDEFFASGGGFHPITVIYQKQEKNPYYNAKYPYGHGEYRIANFSIPRVVCVPKKGTATVRQILETIKRHTAPKLRSSDPAIAADATDAPALTDDEIDSAYTVIISDDKGADDSCGYHESSGYNSSKCRGCLLIEYSEIKARDDQAELEAKKKADAKTAAYRASLASSPVSATAWDPFADEEEETGAAKKDGELGGDATMVDVPISTDGSPEGSEFVKVEMSDGVAMQDSAAPPTGPNLDVGFEPRLAKSYMYTDTEPTPRCAFVVRMQYTSKPALPATQSPAVLVKSPLDDVQPLDADSPVASPAPEGSPEAVEGETPTAPVATPAPWFDPAIADAEIKHSSVDSSEAENAESVSVYDCIKAFSKEETLSIDEMWYCRDCKEHRQATKKFDLWKLPNLLIIHLKRFSYSRYSRDKISTPVHFPLVGLSLAEYTANPAHATDLYDCYAVSNHMGGLGGGHYNAYAKNHANGVWYMHDDSSVSRVRQINDIRSSSAYVLFFQKRKPGTVVKTEAELQADIDAYEAARPKVGYSSGSYSSYGASPSLSELD